MSIFGMRKFHTIGTSFAINGQRTFFLRGKHDGAVFPHAGYPPMDVTEWIRILYYYQIIRDQSYPLP